MYNCKIFNGLNIVGYNQHYWAFGMLTMALQLRSCESSSKKTILLQVVSAIPVDRTDMTIIITCKDDGSPPLEYSQNISLIIKEIVTIPKEVKLINQKPVPENADSFNVGKFQVFNMLTNKPVENEVCNWLKLLSHCLLISIYLIFIIYCVILCTVHTNI